MTINSFMIMLNMTFHERQVSTLKRRYDYDVLRVISMLGVIYLHTVSGSLRNLDCSAVWTFSNIFVAIATPAVPLFFMMSGALLLRDEKNESLNILFRRRLPKIFIPLCAWTGLILIYYIVSGNAPKALSTIQNILNTPATVPYWFLYALIPMYLLSPMLKKMADHLTMAHWHYMMGLWVVCTLGLYTARSFAPDALDPIFTEHWTLNINAVGGYLGYFLLGSYLERLEKIPPKKVLIPVIVLMLAVSILGTQWDTYTHMAYSDRFTNYLTLFTFVLSAAIFLLAKSCLQNKEARGKILPLLSGISFCVYLVHPLVLTVASRIWSRFTGLSDPVTILQQIVLYLCVALACIVIAFILASIKPLCYLFTGQTFSTACKSCNLFALISNPNKERGHK